jgi:hypothetical protein
MARNERRRERADESERHPDRGPESYGRFVGGPDFEWGGGYGGGYGRSAGYGDRGGRGEWWGQWAGESPDESALRSPHDRGFAGRGPRNYRRSDARIEEDVNERLTAHPGIDATEIEVRVNDGEVTLAGTVDDRRSKRLAEDIADSVSGVRDVHNELRIS